MRIYKKSKTEEMQMASGNPSQERVFIRGYGNTLYAENQISILSTKGGIMDISIVPYWLRWLLEKSIEIIFGVILQWYISKLILGLVM